MSQNWYCNQGLLGHPALWTTEEAIAAITTWTADPSLEREAIWPRTKHDVPLGHNTRILMALSCTRTSPGCAQEVRAGLASELVGGPASLNCDDSNFLARSARVTRQMRAAAVLWMTVRESLAPEMRCAALEVVRRQLIAMIVDISPKVDRDVDSSDAASVCSADLRIGSDGSQDAAETDDEGRSKDPRNRASIHTGGPLFRHYARARRGQGESEAVEWGSAHGRRIAGTM
jgi:hypothetical protein